MPDYSFQPGCVDRIWEAVFERGVKKLVATAPTGAGKTHLLCDLFEREMLSHAGRPICYTNRKTIRKQLSDRLAAHGIQHGLRASGHTPDFEARAQVSSLPTEAARSLNKYHPWSLYDGTLAIFDEAHSQKGDVAKQVIEHHMANGCRVVGFTATPVGLGELYDELMILITNSELRRRGVIVPCDVFAPSEMDMSGIDLSADGDYVQTQVQQRFAGVKHAVIGNVLEAYRTLNPTRRPTVLFAPGVPESRWFAETLTQAGIATEHIDAETPESDRLDIFGRFERGETKVLTNYEIVREGWDLPVAEYMIMCRPTKSVVVYTQAVGRILRAAPGKERACLIDHVGVWHQPGLGSPNQDRQWKLTDTVKSVAKAEKKQREERPKDEDKEPVRCPKCARILACRPSHNYQCICGHVFRRSVRMVLQLDGRLEPKVGAVTKRKRPKDDTYFFRSAIYASARSSRTVAQAYGIACRMKGGPIDRRACKLWIPDRDSPEWHRLTADVYKWAAKRRTFS